VKANATIRLEFPNNRRSSAIYEALEVETHTRLAGRSEVKVNREGRTLTLVFEAKDTSALRAALNSYLYWILLTKNALDVLEKH
jgi:tRNA threonylcarbamoyladenosine modification (KEOPS) complex  Pcc1 subunit